jgi:hypothetical protein
MKFLIDIFSINKDKFRFGLQVFSDLNVGKVRLKWAEALDINENQFFPKTIVTPKRGKGNYKKINEWELLPSIILM